MPSNALEELALRWVPGEGPVDIHTPEPGLMNQNCRVERAGRWYSLRVTGRPGEQDLGLDRQWECRVLAVASAAGLAPAIAHCDPAQGIVVAAWMNGRAWSVEEIRQPAVVDALADLLRRVHALAIPQPARAVRPEQWISQYLEAIARCAGNVPPRAAALRAEADSRLRRLAICGPPPLALCHGDLHRFNVVVGARLGLIDWEYAHAADPFWDLAGWIANNDWGEPLAGDLLTSYLQTPAEPGDTERLREQVWLYDYVCLLWSELYLSRRPGVLSEGVAARAERLAARLTHESGSRAR